jgi:membrane protease YdiL (CAAX protease family)
VNSSAWLWIREGAAAILALALLAALDPDRPMARMPLAGAVALGGVAGYALCLTLLGGRPTGPVAMPLPLVVASGALLGVAAAGEEVVWRRVVLGELLRSGPILALAGSSLGFALAHRARPGLHLGTGAVFGGVYLATGVLAASIAAHWSYNVLLLWASARARVEHGERP